MQVPEQGLGKPEGIRANIFGQGFQSECAIDMEPHVAGSMQRKWSFKESRGAESCTGVGKQVKIGLKENKEPGEDVYSEGGECAVKKCSEIS